MNRCLFLVALLMLSAGRDASALECSTLVRSNDEVETAGYDRGLLWRIESNTGAVSHLFGTIHIADVRVTNLDPPVLRALKGSDRFGMEVVLDPDAFRRMSEAMFYIGDRRLSQVLGDDVFERTAGLLARYGISVSDARQLKPWAAYTTLSLPPGQSGMPLDLKLLNMARDAGKPAFGLETIEEQIDVFEGLTNAEQIELLLQIVCHYRLFQQEVDEMVGHYLARDLRAMMRMAIRYRSPLQDRFTEVLLVQRNHRMVERMRAELERGGVFIAIGALHLPGPQGVLNLLREAGYRLSPVY